MRHVNIEEFSPRYGSEVVELILGSLRQMNSSNLEYLANPKADIHHIPDVYKDRSRFWVALTDGQVVGTVAVCEVDAETVELRRLYVLHTLHGSGLGQRLVAQALAFSKSNKYKKMILETDKLMARAHRFYEKVGFTRVGETDLDYLYEREI